MFIRAIKISRHLIFIVISCSTSYMSLSNSSFNAMQVFDIVTTYIAMYLVELAELYSVCLV